MTTHTSSSTRSGADAWIDLFTGGALGLAIGVLAGLSVNPVVAQVLTALVALLGGVIGLSAGRARDAEAGESFLKSLTAVSRVRVIGLGLGLVGGALFGVHARTHRLLSPSPAQRAAAWESAGVPQEEIWKLVVFEELGLTKSADDWSQTSSSGGGGVHSVGASVLFGGGVSDSSLARLSPDERLNKDPAVWLQRMSTTRERPWSEAAAALEGLSDDPEALRVALGAVWVALSEAQEEESDATDD